MNSKTAKQLRKLAQKQTSNPTNVEDLYKAYKKEYKRIKQSTTKK